MMDLRDMEDFLVSLFDPLLTISEKTRLLQEHPVDYAWCLSDVSGPVLVYGIEVVFLPGDACRLIIIPGRECE